MIRVKTISRGWLAALAASALVAVLAGLSISSAHANPAAITAAANPATVAPGGTTTVSVSVAPGTGETVGGAIVKLTFDTSKLTATACTPAALCNTGTAGEVSFALFNPNGLTGEQGTASFTVASSATGTIAVGLAVTDCADGLGDPLSTCTGTGTSITVGATPSPTPSVTATPTPCLTCIRTGGAPGDGGSSLTPWLLAALGLVVVSGGVWAAARMRRETN